MKLTSPAADDHPVDAVTRLISALRGDGGCPWDKKQTPASMARYLLEEAYELADAVESRGPEAACEELGDVLFHILFITFLYQEAGDFDLGDVSRGVTEKMTRRHPHVFGGCAVSSAEEVRANWRKIKQAEKKASGDASAVDSIPGNMPALLRAYQMLKRTAAFSPDEQEVISAGEPDAERRFGELLLAMVRFGVNAGIHPETALRRAVRDYEKRFRDAEKR